MRILHFCDSTDAWNVRLQRFIQNDLNMGFRPVMFVLESALNGSNKWIPNVDKVIVETYKRSRNMAYLLPTLHDPLGLNAVFQKHDCDIVHAHNLPCAYYSYKLGLPTVFNDWEYHYEYYDYQTSKLLSKFSKLFRWYRRRIAKKVIKKLLSKLPVIVTNKTVETKYRELGADRIWTVPNVPSQFEIDSTLNFDIAKKNQKTTCYVGNMSRDNQTRLRNTSGIRELWKQNDLGELLVLEGENYVPHLEIFKTLEFCHYNLLYWKPIDVHRYYLQNKPFLASVVGTSTIISSSLTATIELLGEFALPVNSLEDVKEVVQSERWKHKHSYPKPSHIFEYYAPKIKESYHS